MKVELVLPLPPSTNHLYVTVWRNGKSYRVKSEEAKKYERWVVLAVLAKYGPVKMKKPIKVVGALYMPDWRGIDADNLKVLIDSLAKACGFDDRYMIRNYWDKYVAEGLKPELTVTLTDIEEHES